MFLNRTNVKSLDVAQVGETLYYSSARFSSSNRVILLLVLSVDRPVVAEIRVPRSGTS